LKNENTEEMLPAMPWIYFEIMITFQTNYRQICELVDVHLT